MRRDPGARFALASRGDGDNGMRVARILFEGCTKMLFELGNGGREHGLVGAAQGQLHAAGVAAIDRESRAVGATLAHRGKHRAEHRPKLGLEGRIFKEKSNDAAHVSPHHLALCKSITDGQHRRQWEETNFLIRIIASGVSRACGSR